MNTQSPRTFFLLLVITSVFSLPLYSFAASDLEVGGWIPYWRVAEGTKDATKHIKELDTMHPFGYTVKEDGSLNDMAELKKSAWTRLFKTARKEDVDIIPTVMWSNGVNIHRILSDADLREEHIDQIVSMVKKGKYDGVDIDYEAKRAETKEYYSLFLKELKAKLGSKILSCTTEARTPPFSLYTVVPADIQYANDYKVIGATCDRVNIMAYDQGRADIKLNAAKSGQPYIPVSDADWVRKVLEITVPLIPKEKITLGVSTYGYEYEVSVAPNWFKDYSRQWSLNPTYGVDTAKEYKVTPSRDRGGEMSFSYFPKSSPYTILSSLPVPSGTTSGNKAAAQALVYANATGVTVPVNYVVWSDEGAIAQKVKLAEEFGIRGISIFKIDGGEDQKLWGHLK